MNGICAANAPDNRAPISTHIYAYKQQWDTNERLKKNIKPSWKSVDSIGRCAESQAGERVGEKT